LNKLTSKFSVVLVLAVLLCLAPGAFGQGAVQAGGGSVVLSPMSAGLLVLALGPGGDHHDHHDHGGCGDQGWGSDRGNCSQVPEGGTTFAYVFLAFFACAAAVMFRVRRQSRLSETK